MKRSHLLFAGILLMVVVSGCSRKKDKFINRNYHAITAEYNILYNGQLALEEGKQLIAATYLDNFWRVLPVERIQVSEEVQLPGAIKNEHFRRAEEKAAKAIQKHSMLIQGREKNPQIDEAYLLLGKARYYEQRYVPALEAFNYILQKYPASNTINHARIWREKTNIRLENEQLAIENLKKIIKSKDLSAQDRADANAMLAEAYLNTGRPDSAVAAIRKAARYTQEDEQKGRYLFIQGQLLNLLGKKDSANIAFDRIIELNRKVPREYLLNAYLEKIRNFNYAAGNENELLKHLEELKSDRENRPFLDKIYFQLAEYHYKLNAVDSAIANYNRSLRILSPDNFLNSVSYESLGNIYFDKAEYRLAGAYYDSTLTRIPETSRDFYEVKRKRDNLEEVIFYEGIAEKNDSILRIVAMSDEERLDYFVAYTEKLKNEAVSTAKKGNVPEAVVPVNRTPGAPPAIGSPVTGNTFYFYNPARVVSGMQEFLRIWGPRQLKDNWRLEGKAVTETGGEQLDEVSGLIIASNPEFDPATYLEKVPKETAAIEKIIAERDEAYYKLGLIYKEKFGEYGLASEKLESLIAFPAEERLLIPAHYHLYQIKKELGSDSEAEYHKQAILTTYPDSRYAVALKDPDQAIKIENLAATSYAKLYRLFEQGEYLQALELSEEYSNTFAEDELLPKIELIKAMTIGRLKGFEAYREALNYVALNFPQTEEGKRAQQLYNASLVQMQDDRFVSDSTQANLKLLYGFQRTKKDEAYKLKDQVQKILEETGTTGVTASVDVYDPEKLFLVVHGIQNRGFAKSLAERLRNDKRSLLPLDPVIVSSENYRVIQLHKNLEKYIEQTKNP